MGRPGENLTARIETDRLILVPVGPEHAAALHEAVVASRPELLPWMPWAAAPSLEGSRKQTEDSARGFAAGTRFHFAVTRRDTGLVLGVAGFNNETPGAPELHYWIRTDHAGQGLTTEAGRALIEWARTELKARRIVLWAGRDNTASRRVAEKLGFVHAGPLEWRPEGGLGQFDAESYVLAF